MTSCSRIRIAKMSLSFNGTYCPTIFPIVHGAFVETMDVSLM